MELGGLEAFNFSNLSSLYEAKNGSFFGFDFLVVLEISTGSLDETPTTAYAMSSCF